MGREEKAVIAITLLAILFLRKTHEDTQVASQIFIIDQSDCWIASSNEELTAKYGLSVQDENRDMLVGIGYPSLTLIDFPNFFVSQHGAELFVGLAH